ncbi:hypothetical protein [Streptomyces sp. NPDC048248]|uniref:hypothetical protein n=1 Tax=Streptomyces sp. NPDC048248 TaxID=3365523 RepID=UPI00371B4B4E
MAGVDARFDSLALFLSPWSPHQLSNRYGTAGRLFTGWFAPNLTMTGVFTGTVASFPLHDGAVAVVETQEVEIG